MKRLLHANTYKFSTQAEYELLHAALQKARQAAEARESGTPLGASRGLILSNKELQEWEDLLATMLPHDKAAARRPAASK